MTVVDPMGKLLVEIRSDSAVAAITTRIRAGAPMGKTFNTSGVETDAGDSRGPGAYIPFVVLTRLGRSRMPRVPVQEVRFLAKCYAATDQAAETLAGTVSDAIHHIGARRNASGVLIYASFDDGGEGATKDPDTDQPMASIVISCTASTQLAPM